MKSQTSASHRMRQPAKAEKLTGIQSQRDCATKPRVARNELPWVTADRLVNNPERVVASPATVATRTFVGSLVAPFVEPETSISQMSVAPRRNPFRVVLLLPRFPRVARSSQPWALLRNPFGIQRLGRSNEHHDLPAFSCSSLSSPDAANRKTRRRLLASARGSNCNSRAARVRPS